MALAGEAAKQLRELDALLDLGLLTPEEFQGRRRGLLSNFFTWALNKKGIWLV
jgi:hypothetical protein